MTSSKQYFMLFANCIPINGFSESILLDLQRGGYLPIPNLLYKVLDFNATIKSITEVKKKFNNEFDTGIDKYYSFLEKEEYGFFTNEPLLFPKLNSEFRSPFKIISSVISITENSTYNLENLLGQLIDLGCQLVQIRIFNKFDLIKLKKIVQIFKDSRVNTVEVYLKDFHYSDTDLKSLMENDMRINVIVHSSLKNNDINLSKGGGRKVRFIKDKINENQKEKYAKELFISNTKFYLESKNYNAGLYRKVCVDSDGNIKNYLSHDYVYGNLLSEQIKDIIDTDVFKEKWSLNNDKIEKCKDCQFRYSCLSNSDIKEVDSQYYKVDDCNFNPYENSWDN